MTEFHYTISKTPQTSEIPRDSRHTSLSVPLERVPKPRGLYSRLGLFKVPRFRRLGRSIPPPRLLFSIDQFPALVGFQVSLANRFQQPRSQIYLSVPTPSPPLSQAGPGPHSPPPLCHRCVINKTPQTLAKPLQQNHPGREAVGLISFPLNGPKSFPVIKGGKQLPQKTESPQCRR